MIKKMKWIDLLGTNGNLISKEMYDDLLGECDSLLSEKISDEETQYDVTSLQDSYDSMWGDYLSDDAT